MVALRGKELLIVSFLSFKTLCGGNRLFPNLPRLLGLGKLEALVLGFLWRPYGVALKPPKR